MREFSTKMFIWLIIVLIPILVPAQNLLPDDSYLKINASPDDPVYTTYTAAIARSQLYGDKGYKMDYYSDNEPLHYVNDQAGRLFTVWKIDKVVVRSMGEYAKQPSIIASFSDMVIISYSPFEGIEVEELFWVYSSGVCVIRQTIRNTSDTEHLIELYPILESQQSGLDFKEYDQVNKGFVIERNESLKRLISSMYADKGYPEEVRDVFSISDSKNYSYGSYTGGINDFYNYMKTDFYAEDYKNDKLNGLMEGEADFVSLHAQLKLAPGQTETIQFTRGIQNIDDKPAVLWDEIKSVNENSITEGINFNLDLFSSIPEIDFPDEKLKMIYLSAFNLARGCMLPPSGEAKHDYYVFSREPTWGWGHGHQVLHESLSMLAYVYLDPVSAQGSQRIYMDQQANDGLIAYRHGPRGAQTYPHKDRPTTSAPFYSWINLEVYQVSKDYSFLSDAYSSGVQYMNWLKKERDLDQDGTFEWGPYGIIENVRDWYNAVFQVSEDRFLDVDKEDISDELECLDLSLMVCKEMRSLSKMAEYLDKKKEARRWQKEAEKLADLINERMWDEDSGFYYSINMKDHSFQFMTRDLRRQEIIGFLPLWAGACTAERAEQLVDVLTDSTKFWRKYGIPTLAADDEWYSPHVDYCCKWNGPVWLLWNYMVYDGLINYGYEEVAEQLAEKMIKAVEVQLRKNHNFWESYSPDYSVLNSPSNYIWDSIMAKLLIDVYGQ